MIQLVSLSLCVIYAGAAAPRKFNNSRCPGWWELQAPHMQKDFNINDLEGYYYELAFHDVTQYPLCPSRSRCITSQKAIQSHSDAVKYVNDTWNLACFDHPYPQTLLFNMTETRGYLRGYVPDTAIPFLPKGVVAGTVFPDTVVDFKRGPKGWALEFQCVEAKIAGVTRVAFVGINYYAKSNTEEAFQELDAAARASGLYFFIDEGGVPGSKGLRRVNHTNCPSEPHYHQEQAIIQI
eukprot:TRINITY_DN62176_c0_g1_i1.p1 TRINITY_DN62176_c0_g1~~TRINITY_DN62176_c0_g1_i1.p1  ORF type:complete len:237 (+),score=38.54 TRINITY_DN62176_c0_g1_i1:76-786(+)